MGLHRTRDLPSLWGSAYYPNVKACEKIKKGGKKRKGMPEYSAMQKKQMGSAWG